MSYTGRGYRAHWSGRALALGAALFLLAACAGEPIRPQPSPTPAGDPVTTLPTLPEVKPMVGFRAPNVIGRDVHTGEPVVLAGLEGQTVILNFWATWCLPCEQEMPYLETFYKETAGRVQIVAVGADPRESAQKMADWAAKRNLTFTFVADEGYAFERYKLIGVPATFFIDAAGVIRTRHQGPLTLEQIRTWAAATEAFAKQ